MSECRPRGQNLDNINYVFIVGKTLTNQGDFKGFNLLKSCKLTDGPWPNWQFIKVVSAETLVLKEKNPENLCWLRVIVKSVKMHFSLESQLRILTGSVLCCIHYCEVPGNEDGSQWLGCCDKNPAPLEIFFSFSALIMNLCWTHWFMLLGRFALVS